MDITVKADQVQETLRNLTARSTAIEGCQQRLDTLHKKYAETNDMQGFTADEFRQENLRLNKAAHTLHILNEHFKDFIDKASQNMIQLDETRT